MEGRLRPSILTFPTGGFLLRSDTLVPLGLLFGANTLHFTGFLFNNDALKPVGLLTE